MDRPDLIRKPQGDEPGLVGRPGAGPALAHIKSRFLKALSG